MDGGQIKLTGFLLMKAVTFLVRLMSMEIAPAVVVMVILVSPTTIVSNVQGRMYHA